MTIEVKVPQLPESVADATLVAWHKSPGDTVSRDENLADLETDKVVLEVPAPAAGVLKEIRITDGTTVTAGEILAILEEGEGAPAASPEAAAEPAPGAAPAEQPVEQPAEESGKAAGRLSPSVRRLVEEHGLDPAEIPGSGRDGRISKVEVMEYLERQGEGGKPSPAAYSPPVIADFRTR